MRLADRLVWALLIVVADTVAFAVPLAALALAYIVLARPPWFRTGWNGSTPRRPDSRLPGSGVVFCRSLADPAEGRGSI